MGNASSPREIITCTRIRISLIRRSRKNKTHSEDAHNGYCSFAFDLVGAPLVV
jgi:hypothetical protein